MPWDDLGTLLGIAGFVVGLIGIIVSVVLYFRSKNKYLLEHRMKSTQLITEQMTRIPKLEVTVDGQRVDSLTSTTIEFINSGNQSISSSDFASNEPLGITITGHLHSCDVSADNPNSIPYLESINNETPDNETFCVKFDFLKKKQSFSITLLHDGTVTIFGELKSGDRKEYRNRLTDRTYLYVNVSIDAAISVIFWSMLFLIIYKDVDFLKVYLLPLVIIAVLFIPVFSELLLFIFRKLDKV